MSRKLIVIARPAALKSQWVKREVDIHLASGRAPLIININGALALARAGAEPALAVEEEWLHINETIPEPDGTPTDHALNELIRSCDATRQETKRLRVVGSAAAGLAVLTLLSVIGGWLAIIQRNRAEANHQEAVTNKVSLSTRNGMKAIDDGYLWASWVWFAESLQTDAQRGYPEKEHRVRLQSVQRRLPRLRNVWFEGADGLRCLSSGRQVVAVGDHITVYDTLRSHPPRRLTESESVIKLGLSSADPDSLFALRRVYDGQSEQRSYELVRWSISTGQRTQLLSTGDEILGFSATGQRVLIRNLDQGVQVLELPSLKGLLRGPWQPPVGTRGLTLTTDGQAIIAFNQMSVWQKDVFSDGASTRLLEAQDINHLVLDNSNAFLAVVAQDAIYIIQRDTEALVSVLRPTDTITDTEAVVDLDFNPDGKHLFTTVKQKNGNMVSLVWEIGRYVPKEPVAQIHHEQPVERFEYSPLFPGGGAAASVVGFKRVNPFERFGTFSPDGQLLAAVSEVDDFVRVWNWRVNRPVTPPLRHFGSTIRAFAFNPGGTELAVTGRDDTLRVWEIAIPDGAFLPIRYHDRVDSLTFSPDGAKIAFSGYQPSSQIWDYKENRLLTPLSGHTGAVAPIVFSPDGKRVATGSFDRTVQVFDSETGERISVLNHAHRIDGVVFHSSDKLLTFASAGYSDPPGELRTWEIPSGRLVSEFLVEAAAIQEAIWNSIGTEVAVLFRRGYDSTLTEEERMELSRPMIWELESGRRIRLPVRSRADVEWIQFARKDKVVWVYSGSQIEEFANSTGTPLRSFAIRSPLHRFATLSPDGQRMLVGRWERQAQIIDRKTGEPIAPQMDHDERAKVDGAKFSKNGKVILTVSREKVRAWSADSGELLAPPFVHDVRVNDASISPSGDLVAISIYPNRDGYAGYPSTIYLWSLEADPRPANTIRLAAQVNSSHHVDAAGGFLPLTRDEFREKWAAFEAKVAVEEESSALLDLWHRQQAHQGDDFGKRFHLEQILRRLEDQIAARPSSVDPHVKRAEILQRLNRLEESVLAYEVASQLDPKTPEHYANKAALLQRLGRDEQAISSLNIAIEISPQRSCTASSSGEIPRRNRATRLGPI
jgi:WD40 repeat protein